MTAHLVTVYECVWVVAVVGVPAPVQHQHPQGARHEHNDEQPTNMNIYTSILTSNYIETVDGNSTNKPDIKMSEVSHIPLFFSAGPLCWLPGVAVAGVQETQHREELHQPQEDVQVPTKYF